MKGVALADLHLGYRRFSAMEDGRNVREQDVEKAWGLAVDETIRQQPDLVTIAGDLVHHPRISLFAVKSLRSGVARIVAETNATVVIAKGNHDAGKTAEVLSPIYLADDIQRVYVSDRVERIALTAHSTGESVSVAVLPYVEMGDGESYRLDPDEDADVNVLLVHAAMKASADGDKLPFFYGGDGKALDVSRLADGWDVVACGDYHEFTRLDPDRLAFYSGAIERTTSNIWDEHEPKGLVTYDTAEGSMELNVIPTRGMANYDLGDFDVAPGAGADEVNRVLTQMLDIDVIADKMVRLKVDEFPKHERRAIDWGLVKKLQGKALHFHFDVRYARRELQDLGDLRKRRGMTLASEALSFFADDEPDVRDDAYRYLDVVNEVAELEEADDATH